MELYGKRTDHLLRWIALFCIFRFCDSNERPAKCPSGWQSAGSNCYWVENTGRNFEDHEQFCIDEKNAHACDYANAAELAELKSVLLDSHEYWSGYAVNPGKYNPGKYNHSSRPGTFTSGVALDESVTDAFNKPPQLSDGTCLAFFVLNSGQYILFHGYPCNNEFRTCCKSQPGRSINAESSPPTPTENTTLIRNSSDLGPAKCPSKWQSAGSNCYWVENIKRSFDGNEQFCIDEKNAHACDYANAAELAELMSLFMDWRNYWTGLNASKYDDPGRPATFTSGVALNESVTDSLKKPARQNDWSCLSLYVFNHGKYLQFQGYPCEFEFRTCCKSQPGGVRDTQKAMGERNGVKSLNTECSSDFTASLLPMTSMLVAYTLLG